MKICPYCESEISNTAKKCKHCWEWVINKNNEKENNQVIENWDNSKQKKEYYKRRINDIIWIIIWIILTLIIWFIYNYYIKDNDIEKVWNNWTINTYETKNNTQEIEFSDEETILRSIGRNCTYLQYNERYCWNIINWYWQSHYANWDEYLWQFKNSKRNWYWIMKYNSWWLYKWYRKDWKKHWNWIMVLFDWSIMKWNWDNGEPSWYWEIHYESWRIYKWNFAWWKKEWYWYYDLWKWIYEGNFKNWIMNWKWKLTFEWCTLDTNFNNWIPTGDYTLTCNDWTIEKWNIEKTFWNNSFMSILNE